MEIVLKKDMEKVTKDNLAPVLAAGYKAVDGIRKDFHGNILLLTADVRKNIGKLNADIKSLIKGKANKDFADGMIKDNKQLVIGIELISDNLTKILAEFDELKKEIAEDSVFAEELEKRLKEINVLIAEFKKAKLEAEKDYAKLSEDYRHILDKLVREIYEENNFVMSEFYDANHLKGFIAKRDLKGAKEFINDLKRKERREYRVKVDNIKRMARELSGFVLENKKVEEILERMKVFEADIIEKTVAEIDAEISSKNQWLDVDWGKTKASVDKLMKDFFKKSKKGFGSLFG
jgi:hypothetical protein